MDEFAHLGLVAEIAVALLGFIAIFLALSKTDGRWAESDRHFIQALVMGSSVAVILALAPRVISLFTTDAAIWVSASVLALILGSMTMALQVHLQLQMSREEAARIHWVWHVVAWGLAISAGILFIIGLVDRSNTSAYFISGVSLLVPMCLWVFVGVVFRRFF